MPVLGLKYRMSSPFLKRFIDFRERQGVQVGGGRGRKERESSVDSALSEEPDSMSLRS